MIALFSFCRYAGCIHTSTWRALVWFDLGNRIDDYTGYFTLNLVIMVHLSADASGDD
jgi:hypothetical protein